MNCSWTFYWKVTFQELKPTQFYCAIFSSWTVSEQFKDHSSWTVLENSNFTVRWNGCKKLSYYMDMNCSWKCYWKITFQGPLFMKKIVWKFKYPENLIVTVVNWRKGGNCSTLKKREVKAVVVCTLTLWINIWRI